MREQEKAFHPSKRETRESFLKRLHRVAFAFPSATMEAAVGDMKHRCLRLQQAGGGNIEEGGKQA